MKFVSTRSALSASLEDALLQGIAPDGGLYVPEHLPKFTLDDFTDCASLTEVAERYLQPFFAGVGLEESLPAIVAETFSFEIPLVEMSLPDGSRGQVLELFHGPTAAFKDVGAGFLAACMARLIGEEDPRGPVRILVATSGDTGGAVAAAFHRQAGFEVCVLFPTGRVSARQQHQLTCWGDNVSAFSVDGSFDDCQRMVKAAFVDTALQAQHRLSSANSINIGRLLPQSVYYAHAALSHFRETGRELSFVVPTGNLGNGLAAILARACKMPIGNIVLATNANTTIPDYFKSGELDDRDSVATLASAMDVGKPSNLERLINLFGPAEDLRQTLTARSCSDHEIKDTIRRTYEAGGYVCCPHTATAIAVLMNTAKQLDQAADWASVATAHPAKFESVVEPVIEREVVMPASLEALLARPAACETLAPTLAALRAAIR